MRFLGSRKSLAYLGGRFPGQVSRVTGFELAVLDSEIVLLDPLLTNLSRGICELEHSRRLFAQIDPPPPQLVIGNFEPLVVWWAPRPKLPASPSTTRAF